MDHKILLLLLVGEAGGPHIVEGADVLLLLEIREIGTTHQLRDAEGLRGQGQRRLVEVGGVEKELPQGLVRRGREGVSVLVVILDALRQHGEIAAQVRDVERDVWETARYIGLQELQRSRRILDSRTVDPLQLVAEQPRRINTAASRVHIDHHGVFIEEAPDRVEGGIRQIGLLRQQRGQADATELTGIFDPLQLLQRRVDVWERKGGVVIETARVGVSDIDVALIDHARGVGGVLRLRQRGALGRHRQGLRLHACAIHPLEAGFHILLAGISAHALGNLGAALRGVVRADVIQVVRLFKLTRELGGRSQGPSRSPLVIRALMSMA